MQAAAKAQNPVAEQVIRELTGAAPAAPRTDKEWESAYAQALEALIASAPASLEPIILRAAAPGAEAQRGPLLRAMLAYFDKKDRLNDRVFLLRQLTVVGGEESVPPLAGLLKQEDQVLRQYALAALTTNHSPAACEALLAALKQAEGPEWRVALVNALGGRRETAAVEVLAKLTGDAGEGVAAAAAMALGHIGTDAAANALRAAQTTASPKLALEIVQARLLAADLLRGEWQKDAAHAIYKDVLAVAKPSYVRMAAVRGLVLLGADEALPLLVEAMKSGDVRVQAAAARLTVDLPGKDTAKKLLAVMPQLPAPAQAFLLEALADRDEGQNK
ncbi:MAG: HEAT repeat domain-containing protein [Thermoguttaceae bacterium]